MKKIFSFIFLLFPVFSFAQMCQDTMRQADRYHSITETYSPVCGCDGFTYRNTDAAYWWGGINYWDGNGPCEDFDMDLYPNVITPDPSAGFGNLRIYMKKPGTVTLLIYNSSGLLMLEKLFSNNLYNSVIPTTNPYRLIEPQSYRTGIYILIVTLNGVQKSLKFTCIGKI